MTDSATARAVRAASLASCVLLLALLPGCSSQPDPVVSISTQAASTPADAQPTPAPDGVTMEHLVSSLPQEEDLPTGMHFSVECRSLDAACAGLWGIGVVGVEDAEVSKGAEVPKGAEVSKGAEGVGTAAPGGARGFRISIYPETGPRAAVVPADAYASAQRRCAPGRFEEQPVLDPRGLGPHRFEGERGTVTALDAEVAGWRTVSCLREYTRFRLEPSSVPSSPAYVDTGEHREAHTAALGTSADGEDVLVLFLSGSPERLAEVREAYFTRLAEAHTAGR